MTTITALAAISSVGLEMTSSDTMPVTRMATKPAWKAGWVRSVTKVCVRAAGWVGKCWWPFAFGARFPPLQQGCRGGRVGYCCYRGPNHEDAVCRRFSRCPCPDLLYQLVSPSPICCACWLLTARSCSFSRELSLARQEPLFCPSPTANSYGVTDTGRGVFQRPAPLP